MSRHFVVDRELEVGFLHAVFLLHNIKIYLKSEVYSVCVLKLRKIETEKCVKLRCLYCTVSVLYSLIIIIFI